LYDVHLGKHRLAIRWTFSFIFLVALVTSNLAAANRDDAKSPSGGFKQHLSILDNIGRFVLGAQ